jgi:hypothetical protein
MVGRIALPVTRVALKTTGLIAGAADMGLEAVERKVAAVDPSKVHALVEWLNEELAILGAMAPVVMKNADLHNMLEEIGIGDDAANDADLGEFASWINGDSDFATQLLDAVEAQKVQSDEDLAEQACSWLNSSEAIELCADGAYSSTGKHADTYAHEQRRRTDEQ